jgi:hypothetical protein
MLVGRSVRLLGRTPAKFTAPAWYICVFSSNSYVLDLLVPTPSSAVDRRAEIPPNNVALFRLSISDPSWHVVVIKNSENDENKVSNGTTSCAYAYPPVNSINIYGLPWQQGNAKQPSVRHYVPHLPTWTRRDGGRRPESKQHHRPRCASPSRTGTGTATGRRAPQHGCGPPVAVAVDDHDARCCFRQLFC